MSSSPPAFSFNHLSPPLPPSEQLCYVHCNFCDTVLAVSVPCSSLFKTVTVRCGHCNNLLSVNMRGLLFPGVNNLQFAPLPPPHHHNLILDERTCAPPSLLIDPANLHNNNTTPLLKGNQGERPHNALEKRQRVPSAYNRFIKDEIQRIKAGNPDITHREAFSAAAKNWAHFPHIHFGMMPDQGLKKNNNCQQEGGDVLLKDGFYASAAANAGVTPF